VTCHGLFHRLLLGKRSKFIRQAYANMTFGQEMYEDSLVMFDRVVYNSSVSCDRSQSQRPEP
jgi:hypothetical protein